MDRSKLYRIGDFSKKLGVTPDFLKYCERRGIITSEKEINGYRYYDFRQAATILDYLKLQNQGFSAEESYAILHAETLGEYVQQLKKQNETLRHELNFKNAMLNYNITLSKIQGCFTDPPTWFVRPHEAMWFLPHSKGRELSDDPDTYKLIAEWNNYFPVVFSASRREDILDSNSIEWGFMVTDSFAKSQGIDISPPVLYIPPDNYLEVYIKVNLESGKTDSYESVQSILDRLGLKPSGPLYEYVVAKLMEKQGRRSYSIFSIPVRY